MKPAHSIVLVLLALLAATPAAAQFFAAAGAGQARWSDCYAGGPCDGTDASYSLRVGYLWAPYFGIEARYADLGESFAMTGQGTANGESFVTGVFVAAKAFGLNAIVTAPLSERASVSAIAGIASIDAKAGIRSGGGLQVFDALYNGSDRKATPYYGLRAGWRLTRDWGVGVEAVRYRVDFRGLERDADALNAEITYRFP